VGAVRSQYSSRGKKADIQSKSIAAIGLTGSNAVWYCWMVRVKSYAQQFYGTTSERRLNAMKSTAESERKVYSNYRQPCFTWFHCSQILWVAENRPEVYAKVKHPSARLPSLSTDRCICNGQSRRLGTVLSTWRAQLVN
jgi:sugar (pentulose or hexulose) kinase